MVLCYILGRGRVLSGVQQELDLTCIKGNNKTLSDVNVSADSITNIKRFLLFCDNIDTFSEK